MPARRRRARATCSGRISARCRRRRRPYSIAEQFRIPLSLARERVHLVHEPHYVLPPLIRCRSVVTIHDCIHLMFPQYLPSRLAYVYAQGLDVERGAQGGPHPDGVGGVEARHPALLRHPAGEGDVIYNAIDERFLAPADPERMDLVRQRYQLDHPFVLYVGNIKPHKNLERLIDAFGRARGQAARRSEAGDHRRRDLEVPGAAAGGARTSSTSTCASSAFSRMDTLAAFYRLARAFVFPSLYEGFGLPPLEAMACGTPVVTSNVSSLPEVAGGAALLVDPYDPASIADGIARAVTDETLRADLIATGLARAAAVFVERVGRRPSTASTWRCSDAVKRRADPRLAHRHARRRAGARSRSARCSPTPICSRWCTCRARPTRSSSGAACGTSPIQWLPFAGRLYRHYLPLFPIAIEQFDLDGYDLVLSTSHCAAKSVVVHRPHAAPLLLPDADALRVGSVRRLLRAGARRAASAAALLRPVLAATGAVGPRHRRPRTPLSRYLSICCAEDRAVL